jgi:CheY-like chemotaxis protein
MAAMPGTPCVLIVEDDEDVRGFMDCLLKASGYETMTAANGAMGLEAMQHRLPSVVLLDLQMPVMDGWTFRARQLDTPALAKVPVVAVTAWSEPDEVRQRLHIACLSKPVDFDLLLGAVSRACRDTDPR